MILGYYSIFQCPKCGTRYFNHNPDETIRFGTKLYSDGRRTSPFALEFPDITRCTACKTIFTLDSTNDIGKCGLLENLDEKWGLIKQVRFLTVNGYLEAIRKKIYGFGEDELSYRISIWWRYNDRLRDGKAMFKDDKDHAIWENNLSSMVGLLNSSKHHKLILAEIYRNTGRFKKSMAIASKVKLKVNDIENALLKLAIIEQCMQGNSLVCELL